MKKSNLEYLFENTECIGYCLDDSTEVLDDLTCSNLSSYRYVYKIKLEAEKHNKVRLFPINSNLCAITNLVIFTDIGSININETNGTKIQSDYFFLNEKPFFSFNLSGNETWIELQANILTFDSEIFSEMFSIMLNALEEKSSLEKERIKYLNSNEKLSRVNELSQNHVRELKHTVYQLTLEREQLKNDKNAILNSEFWKITKPLRKAVDILKKVNHKKDESPKKKIKKIKNFAGVCSGKKDMYEVVLPEVLKSYDNQKKKKILLSTHELALTGAPVAVLYFAEMLKENDFLPVIISPSHGRLEEECKRYNIPVIIESSLYKEAVYLNYIHLFDGVVANTIVSAPIINALDGSEIPVLWWIHESEASYRDPNFIKPMPQHIPPNVSVYTVGDYAYKMLKKYRPLYRAKELLYFIPEFDNDSEIQYSLPVFTNDKMVFCIIGLQEYRKGQDILVDAIRELSSEELKQAYFVFVGKKCHPLVYQRIEEILQYAPENALWIEELSREEIGQLYEQIDCLVCASRDDPMPIVATEALQHGRILICSESTGTASIVEKEQCGFVYCNNSSKELAKKMKELLSRGKNWRDGEKGREVYKKYFSKEVFTKNALIAIEETLSLKKCLNSNIYTSLSFENMLDKMRQEKENTPYTIYNSRELLNYDENQKQNILLISHELSLTGAPIVFHMLAKCLREIGYNVIVVSPYDGPLSKKIELDGIPVIVYPSLYANTFIQQFAECFNLIFTNTVVTFRIIYQLQYCKIPIIWWIHDSEASYRIGGFRDCMIDNLPEHVHVYCAGEYAREKLLEYYPTYKEKADVLYYCVPDVVEQYKNDTCYPLAFNKNDRLVFAVIGQQDERKGHDILVEAIKKLDKQQREKAVFLFVGGHLDKRIENEVNALCALYPENVYYIEQVEHRKMFSLYKQCDCIICSSKDDPLPVFITEAMMMSKIIICSENTGSAPILRQNDCGLLYTNNDPIQLKEQIVYVLENYFNLDGMVTAARSTYLKLFTEEIFKENVNNIVKKHLLMEDFSIKYPGTVSVIVPTYNAGIQFETLITSIMGQKGIKNVELIVVDSGSTDDTVSLCQKYSIILKQIPNEDFTHSYARNLGAMQASGDVFVFMTQDALPIGEYWLYNMILPIISGEAVATSGRELCPPSTELFYKVSAMGYAKYLGTLHNDQLNYCNGDETLDELRRKASITDIASAICAPVFQKYLYRYSYAEDLDMGIRLLKEGYRIKLLSNVRVLHGHNRNSGYYVRRGFVEQHALGKILPNFIEETMSSRLAALKVVSACEVAYKSLTAMKRSKARNCTIDEYFHEFITNLQIYSNMGLVEHVEYSFDDVLFDKCIEICKQFCINEVCGDYEIVNSLILYINNDLITYLKANEVQFIDTELADAINSCVIKQLAFCVGSMMSKAQSDDERVFEFQSLMVGV